MRDISIKKQKDFVSQVTKGLLEIGAVIQQNTLRYNCTIFHLDTVAGNLEIILRHDQGSLYSVFSIFDNPKVAKEKFNCNPNSGKYNFHSTETWMGAKLTPQEVAEKVIHHFEITLKK